MTHAAHYRIDVRRDGRGRDRREAADPRIGRRFARRTASDLRRRRTGVGVAGSRRTDLAGDRRGVATGRCHARRADGRGRLQHTGVGRVAARRLSGGESAVCRARFAARGRQSFACTRLCVSRGGAGRSLSVHRIRRQRRTFDVVRLSLGVGVQRPWRDDRRCRRRSVRQGRQPAGTVVSRRPRD